MGKCHTDNCKTTQKKMDGDEDPSLCAMSEMLTAINETSAISQKSMYDLAMLHPVRNKEKQPNK